MFIGSWTEEQSYLVIKVDLCNIYGPTVIKKIMSMRLAQNRSKSPNESIDLSSSFVLAYWSGTSG